MKRSALITTVAIAAVSMVSTPAVTATVPVIRNLHAGVPRAPHRNSSRTLEVLYDQTSNDSSSGTLSQDMGDVYTSRAADDFTVPEGTHWMIEEVDVTGAYLEGPGPARSVEVTFHRSAHHKPGGVKMDAAIIPTSDDNGSFRLKLGKNSVRLKPGHYWISVVANMDFAGFGEWLWENQTAGTTEGDPAVWENPMGGLGVGCTTWTVESKCTQTPLGDHIFVLKGRAR